MESQPTKTLPMGSQPTKLNEDSEQLALQTEAANFLKCKHLDKNNGVIVEVPEDRYETIISLFTKVAQGGSNQTSSKPEALPDVYIVNNTSTEATDKFVDHLSEFLKTEGITSKLWTTEEDKRDSSIFTIYVCNNDQDVISYRNEHSSKQYNSIAIWLYVTPEETLDNLRSETKFEGYEIRETIIEMAFTLDKGIYTCKMNDSAREKILAFWNSKLKRKQGYNGENEEKTKLVSDENQSILWETINYFKRLLSCGVEVFIADPDPTDVTGLFVNELKKKLLKEYNIELTKVNPLEEQSDTNKFTILICNNHSRLFSDIQHCLDNVKAEQYERIIVVVLHVKRNNQLPENSTANEIKDSENQGTYTSIKAFIDMAYTQDDKIYECDMNKTAFEDLERILKVNMSQDSSDRESNGNQELQFDSESDYQDILDFRNSCTR